MAESLLCCKSTLLHRGWWRLEQTQSIVEAVSPTVKATRSFAFCEHAVLTMDSAECLLNFLLPLCLQPAQPSQQLMLPMGFGEARVPQALQAATALLPVLMATAVR